MILVNFGDGPVADHEPRPEGQAERPPDEPPQPHEDEHPAYDVRDTDQWSRWSRKSAWTSKDWDRWQRGRWWEEQSQSSESSEEIQWDEFDRGDTDILPSAILGWLLLRRSGLSSSARLAIQSATQKDLDFTKIERALRDQEEELLSSERRGFTSPGHQAKRRFFWVEQERSWGLLLEDPDDVHEDQIHWQSFEPDDDREDGSQDTFWSHSPTGTDLEWTFYEGALHHPARLQCLP